MRTRVKVLRVLACTEMVAVVLAVVVTLFHILR
jgi:hypothetical protein